MKTLLAFFTAGTSALLQVAEEFDKTPEETPKEPPDASKDADNNDLDDASIYPDYPGGRLT